MEGTRCKYLFLNTKFRHALVVNQEGFDQTIVLPFRREVDCSLNTRCSALEKRNSHSGVKAPFDHPEQLDTCGAENHDQDGAILSKSSCLNSFKMKISDTGC